MTIHLFLIKEKPRTFLRFHVTPVQSLLSQESHILEQALMSLFRDVAVRVSSGYCFRSVELLGP